MESTTIEISGPKLTDHFSPEEIEQLKSEIVLVGVPVRFLHEGHNLNIVTGALMPRGANVIYQTFYWRLTRDTAARIAEKLGVRAEFSAV